MSDGSCVLALLSDASLVSLVVGFKVVGLAVSLESDANLVAPEFQPPLLSHWPPCFA